MRRLISPPPKTLIEVISGEINWGLIAATYDKLMSGFNKKILNRLVLIIASPGGEVDACWGLYSLLKALPIEIVTVAAGRVFSAATILYMLGEERCATPETVFLFHATTHEGYNKGECTTAALQEAIKGSLIDREHFARVVASKTKAPKQFIDGIVNPLTPVYLNVTQALQYEIVTKVIEKITDIG